MIIQLGMFAILLFIALLTGIGTLASVALQMRELAAALCFSSFIFLEKCGFSLLNGVYSDGITYQDGNTGEVLIVVGAFMCLYTFVILMAIIINRKGDGYSNKSDTRFKKGDRESGEHIGEMGIGKL